MARKFNGYKVVEAKEILYATLPAYKNKNTGEEVAEKPVTLVVTRDNMAVIDPIVIYTDTTRKQADGRVFYPDYVEVPDIK